MATEEVTTKHSILAPDYPISSVTVYTDRAEVNRSISLKLPSGLNEVHVENVPAHVIGESIRVDGKGNASIQEVQLKEHCLEDSEVSNPKFGIEIESLKAELDVLKAQKEALEDTNAVIEKQLHSLGELINSFGKLALAKGNNGALTQFDATSKQSLESLYEYHEAKAKQLKERVRSTGKERDELDKKIDRTERELDKLTAKGRVKKTVVVLLRNNSEMEEQVILQLTYQVRCARWSPSYDVRINLDSAKEQQQIQLTYFGNITQQSGEEWKDVKLALSTAQPNAGSLPRLGTTEAHFPRVEPARAPAAMPAALFGAARTASRQMKKMYKRSEEESEEAMGFGLFDEMQWDETKAEEQALSTNFNIVQPKTIPDDNSEHKVTIAVLDFNAVPIRYDCVPSKNTNVFMSATVLNSSQYPLLRGWASIYVNNCFTQRVSIDSVTTGDRFNVPLGVNPNIKLVYKPAHRYHHQTGMISKSSNLVHEQKIQLKNTKQEPVLVTLHEPVPKSTDEKIKVRLVSPEVKHQQQDQINGINGDTVVIVKGSGLRRPSSASSSATAAAVVGHGRPPSVGARLNADNNLEWGVMVDGGGKELELIVKWEAEYPHNEKLELTEKMHH